LRVVTILSKRKPDIEVKRSVADVKVMLRIAEVEIEAFCHCCREESFLVRDGEKSFLSQMFRRRLGETDDDDKSFLSLF
jgi:hypothetical protein